MERGNEMEKNYETRHIYMALGICIVLASPILLIFVPRTIGNIAHQTIEVWHVIVPTENYIVYGVGLLFLFLAAMVLWILEIKKFPIILSMVFVFLSVIAFYIGSQSYQALSDDAISYSTIFSRKDYTYSWDEIEKVIYYKNLDGGFSEYEFIFSDGNNMKISENGYIVEIRHLIYYKLREVNVVIERH